MKHTMGSNAKQQTVIKRLLSADPMGKKLCARSLPPLLSAAGRLRK